MKQVLLDQGTPVPLRGHLSAHRVDTAFEMGWSTLSNGGLLAKAEAAGYSVLVTTDKNLRYQQNLAGRNIAVVMLGTTSCRGCGIRSTTLPARSTHRFLEATLKFRSGDRALRGKRAVHAATGVARRTPRLAAAAFALAAAFGLQIEPGGTPGWATAVAQETVRPEVGRPLQAARDLIKAKKYNDALAKLREAEAVPKRSAHETFLIEQMRASAAVAGGNNDEAIKALQALINSGRLPEAEQGRYAATLAGLYYRARDYKNAANWAQRALKSNPGDGATRSLMIQSYYLAGDFATAGREAMADIQAAERAGQTPAEDKLQLLANIAGRNGGDRAAYLSALEKLVAYYPKREYWADLLRRIESKPGFSSRLSFEVYRLRAATRTIDSAADYMEYAQLALQQRQAAEAKKALDEGFANGKLGKGDDAERQKRLLALATQRAESAAADLATAEAEATTNKNGDALVQIGLAYTGMGQFDKGIGLIQAGIKKGGLRHPQDAQLHLGIALHRAGQKQRAAQALKAVTGTDGVADLARLWMRVP